MTKDTMQHKKQEEGDVKTKKSNGTEMTNRQEESKSTNKQTQKYLLLSFSLEQDEETSLLLTYFLCHLISVAASETTSCVILAGVVNCF